MTLQIEIGKRQLNKHGEELCGDSIEVARAPDSTIVVVSDGLGSGVKANILSSLTTKMATTMLVGGCTLEEVIESLAHTLPVCEVRHLAYSTFTILQMFDDGRVYLAEYDNPATIIGRGQELWSIERTERTIGERTIREALFSVGAGDWLAIVSDGVPHAGIGGIWNLGWGLDKIAAYLKQSMARGDDAQTVADEIAGLCQRLYDGSPGDDATVLTVRIRDPHHLTVLVGPPRDRADDPEVVAKLMAAPGKRAICGGTTGNLVARELGRPITVDLASMDERVPPVGVIDGVDLVTEGMLTVSYAVEKLRGGARPKDLRWRRDGASRLTELLLEADQIDIIVGRALNPAHQSPEVPVSLGLKQKVVEDLVRVLTGMKKTVRVEYH
ncbi:MAG: SpoIIE family protein phosphatase [Chloroflexota bacterium]